MTIRFDYELVGQIFDPHHAGNQNEIENRPDTEESQGKQPQESCNPSSEVKTLKSENPKSTAKPEKISDEYALHSNRLGKSALDF